MFLKSALLLFVFLNIYKSEALPSKTNCLLPSLENGRVKIRQRMRLIKYFCNEGYQLLGNTYATCRNGEWDNPEPVCIRSGCKLEKLIHGMELQMRGGALVIYFCLPGYKLVGQSVLHCNGRSWNSSIPTCVDTNATAELSCNFEDESLCGWTQDELHDFDWKRLNKKTPSSFLFTGPSSDHTLGPGKNGYYMYIESTSRSLNDTARLLSPIYKQHLSVNGCFSFYYHMFGKSIGGLRVFQKPDNVPLQDILRASGYRLKRYLLFEQWGNLGDVWYGSVSKLKDFGDNFQIVIEAIRGHSVTSDIAIDDVAILQGNECDVAMQKVTTPNPDVADSCVGRCDLIGVNVPERGCGCTAACVADSDCCHDFYDACLFNSDEPGAVSVNNGPQTEKLVASSPTETDYHEVPTTTETTIKTTAKTTPTTKNIPTTATTPTTTPSTTTKIATTPKRPITVIFKTTPKPPVNGTVNISTEIVQTTKASVVTTSTTKKPVVEITTDKKVTATEVIPVTKAEKKVVTKELNSINDEGNSSSGAKRAAIVLGVLLCIAGCIYLLVTFKGSKGLSMVAKLRGNVSHDPEVRFLTRDDDEDNCS